MNSFFRKAWPYLVVLLVFFAVGCIYMSPALDGKMIVTSDGYQSTAAVHEGVQYHEETGERTWWTGSMFSGMPNYQIGGGRYEADNWLMPFRKVLLSGYDFVPLIVFFYCVAFFILLSAMKINKWIAAVGALAIAFSSYFFIIIGANHFSKTTSLAWMSVVAAGFYLIFHRKRGVGIILTMIFSAIGMYPHPQMAYYMCFIIVFFLLAELWLHLKEKRMKDFAVSALLFAAAFGVGIGTGTSAVFTNMEYAKETMRGGHSDLVKDADEEKTGGLSLEYATAWSYGIDETLTFLVPNYMGGSSNYPLGKESDLYKTMVKRGIDRRTADQICQSAPTYWGDQPFTAGPVYLGAAVCFLFVLGLCIVKGPYKWALLAITLLSVFLSWGNHWMGLTKLFFNIVPLYNKFRAVSSILVIAEITIPILGFLAIKQLMEGNVSKEKALRSIYLSAGVTGGLCLLLALFGTSLFSFVSGNDERMFAQWPGWLVDAVVAQRASMFTSDCWRSLLFVVLTAGLFWAYVRFRMKTGWLAVLLGVLVLADMWPVNKRYMNDSMFMKPLNFEGYFKMQPYEKQILQDKDPHFRVFNLTANPFNDARTSYYLKSIGGYHAAKLRRYQDLIEEHLSKMNMSVVNMLNAKYIITPDKSGGAIPQYNAEAMGNAWFVDSLLVVDSPNEESDALNRLDLATTAVLDREFAEHVKDFVPGHDSAAVVKLTKYTPEYIEYDASASKPGTIVFSEVYYPYGWKAYIDGEPADHFRVNYLLRALNVPAGDHHIRFEFRPDSVRKGNTLSMIFVVIMYLTVFAIVIAYFRRAWRNRKHVV